MEETFAAQLEWWANSTICMRFDVLITIEERSADLAARGRLADDALADGEAVEIWDLLCEASPFFRLAFEDGSAFEVVLRAGNRPGEFTVSECGSDCLL
ncbi:hypothetical protein [Glycomyces lechevalierae]|uniref:Uncharacterized protein n=1 Tax=Glycomyces lechevalierae TaxID=256034 RepID=A0A9X3SV50_9ACTN|nr:hypothetical protein [Glycomyces lechevalierae]MDA1386250.1 hypothetical protein [Glycomyces lechevalierae]MDR7338277.1 hypothetical protein [Glycomyces lechevalierae]